MLGKLIKNEFKAYYLEICICFGMVFFSFCIFGLSIRLISQVMITISIILLVGSCVSLLVFLIKSFSDSFYKKLFTNEGYLTFSLPVTVDQLLFSKYLVGIVWIICSYIVLYISAALMLIIGGGNVSSAVGGLIDFSDLFSSLLISTYRFFIILINIIFYFTIILLIMIIMNIGKIKKKKSLIGVLMFYAFFIVLGIIENVVVIIPYALVPNGNEFVLIKNYEMGMISINEAYSLNHLLYVILISVGAIFLIRYLFNKKLELE